MATAPIRAAVKAWLTEHLGDALSPVDVSNGWPGRNLQREHVWIDRVTGTMSVPFSMADRKIRDDEFTVRVVFQAVGVGDDIAASDSRALELFAALDDLLADDPSLGDEDGVIHATLATVEGPNGELTDEGAVSFVMAEVAVSARMS